MKKEAKAKHFEKKYSASASLNNGPLLSIVQKLNTKQNSNNISESKKNGINNVKANVKTSQLPIENPPAAQSVVEKSTKAMWGSLRKRKSSQIASFGMEVDRDVEEENVNDEEDNSENEGYEADPDPYIEAENKEIRRLSKLLGITNKATGRNKLNKEYMENEVSNLYM